MLDFEWNISEILYDFDGPKIFTISNQQGLFLAYFCDEDTVHKIDRFIVVPTDDNEIKALKECHIDMASVLSKDCLYLVDIYFHQKFNEYYRLFSPKMSFKDLEVDYIPEPGVFLYPWKCLSLQEYPDYHEELETNFHGFCSETK